VFYISLLSILSLMGRQDRPLGIWGTARMFVLLTLDYLLGRPAQCIKSYSNHEPYKVGILCIRQLVTSIHQIYIPTIYMHCLLQRNARGIIGRLLLRCLLVVLDRSCERIPKNRSDLK